MTDLVLASLHHLLAFALAAILAAEWVLVRPGLAGRNLALLARIDGFYGMCALLLVLVGAGRVAFGLKGWEFYLGNHVFWTKMAAFAAVGLLSIKPTLRILGWRKAETAGPVSDAEIGSVRAFLKAEIAVFALIPVLAAALARSY